MTVFVGDDWAEAHHDVHLMNEAGDRLWLRAACPRAWMGSPGSMRWSPNMLMIPPRWWWGSRPSGACGFRRWSRRGIGCMRSTRCRCRAIGTVTTWRARSPTRATPRCWPIWSAPTGTTTGPSPGTATPADGVKVLARAHQNLIWDRTRHTNRLRNDLREYFPAALEAFDDLAHPDAVAVLAKAPAPELTQPGCRSPRSVPRCNGAVGNATSTTGPPRSNKRCAHPSSPPHPRSPPRSPRPPESLVDVIGGLNTPDRRARDRARHPF